MIEAQFVAINRKADEDRTDADWQFLRDWERERSSGWPEVKDGASEAAKARENARLRAEVKSLREEVGRLGALLREEQNRKQAIPKLDDKVQKTVDWMRQTGASEEDVLEFIAGQA